MKVNELRIGNFINNNEEVISISFDGSIEVSYDTKEKGNATVYRDISYCEPIPLTEEWLVKFGLKIELIYLTGKGAGYCEFYTLGDYGINTLSLEDIVLQRVYRNGQGADWICKLKYVHQLQNIYFALIGEELEIK